MTEHDQAPDWWARCLNCGADIAPAPSGCYLDSSGSWECTAARRADNGGHREDPDTLPLVVRRDGVVTVREPSAAIGRVDRAVGEGWWPKNSQGEAIDWPRIGRLVAALDVFRAYRSSEEASQS